EAHADSLPDGHVWRQALSRDRHGSKEPSRRLAPAVAGTAASGLDGLLDLAGLEAARADVRTLRLAVQDHPHALKVRVEAPLRRDHRMAPMVAEAGLFPADRADLGHRRPMVAERPSCPARLCAAARR